MQRSVDAGHLASVWNHPKVKPWVALGAPELLTEENAGKLFEIGSIYLANEYGGFLFIPCGNDVYDLHTQFVPEGWGGKALEDSAWAKWYMFTQTPCMMMRTFVPLDNKVAYVAAEKNGFVYMQDEELAGIKGRTLVLTIKKWVVDLCQSRYQ
jgi:hypothetical protein